MAVYSLANGMKRLDDCEPLPLGQVVSYWNQSCPKFESVVVSEEFGHYGQLTIRLDGTGSSEVSRVNCDGPGGHKIEDRILTAEEIAAVEAAYVKHEEESRIAREKAYAEADKQKEAANAWWAENKPEWAKAILIAQHEKNESDLQSDYWGSSTTRTVLLAWSKHTRDLFPEMRKAAAKFEPTAYLADADKSHEHREKYSMGGGYYLGADRYSGWKIRKVDVGGSALTAAANPEDRAPIEKAEQPSKTIATAGGARVEKHYHDKREIDFWIVVLGDRVDRETFEAVRDRCKAAGGWYSRKWRSTPGGFAFDSEEAATAFAADLDGPAAQTKLDDTLVEKLRDLADGMDKTIEQKLAPMSQNWTPKRSRQHASRVHDGHDLQRAQAALRALADARERGELPEILVPIRTKRQVIELTGTKADCSGGHYAYRETDEPCRTTSEAVALRELMNAAKTPEDKEAELAAKRDAEIRHKLDALRGCTDGDFFPTPRPVIEQMLYEADIEDGMRVLEPSAGIASICEVIREQQPGAEVEAVERFFSLAEICELKGFATTRGDFLEMHQPDTYDRIVMNPPFGRGADVKHVKHAYEMVKPGGRVVALMANGAAFRKFESWLCNVGWSRPLPSGSFDTVETFHRTGVEINLVVIDKANEFELAREPAHVTQSERFESLERTRQRPLIDGLKCLPGQQDLF